MKAKRLRSRILSGATQAELETAINAWFAGSSQAIFYSLHRLSDLSVIIVFVPGGGEA